VAGPGTGAEGSVLSGPWVAVDVGTVRIGVAASDPDGLLASPVATVQRDRRGRDLDEIAVVVAEAAATLVLVGLPMTLAGIEGPSAVSARAYAAALATRIAPVPVRLLDERLTTVVATTALRAGGVPGRRQRSIVDRAAATALLQTALDQARSTGGLPGEPL